jgi:MFS family permease
VGETARETPHTRYNFAMLVGDVTGFYIGMAFLDSATVLPVLVNRLGGSEIFLGVLLAARQAAYYLPQPISAHLLQGKTRFQPFLLQVVGWGRIWLIPAALLILLFGQNVPAIALWAFAIAYSLSWLGDGLGGVPWTAMVGRAIPVDRRGRLFATTQVLGGISRLVVSVLVGALLAGKLLPFPASLALITLLGGIFLGLSWGFLVLIREPAPSLEEQEMAQNTETVSFLRYLRQLPLKFRERPDIARLAIVQILGTATSASVPFLLLTGQSSGKEVGELSGWLQAAQTIGFLSLAPVWGLITDRIGARTTIASQFGIGLLVPICAFVVLTLSTGTPTGFLSVSLMILVYFCHGAVMDMWATTTNYLLEATSLEERAVYIGLLNAATGPCLLLPLGAGILAQTVGKPILFALTLLLLGTGLFLALSLPETRRKKVAKTVTKS